MVGVGRKSSINSGSGLPIRGLWLNVKRLRRTEKVKKDGYGGEEGRTGQDEASGRA
jgi:hypothetical protein